MKWVLFGTLVFLNLMDVAFTQIAFMAGLAESNPIVTWVTNDSIWAILGWKLAVLAVMGVLIYLAKKPKEEMGVQVLTLIGVVGYAIVVGINFGGLLILQQL